MRWIKTGVHKWKSVWKLSYQGYLPSVELLEGKKDNSVLNLTQLAQWEQSRSQQCVCSARVCVWVSTFWIRGQAHLDPDHNAHSRRGLDVLWNFKIDIMIFKSTLWSLRDPGNRRPMADRLHNIEDIPSFNIDDLHNNYQYTDNWNSQRETTLMRHSSSRAQKIQRPIRLNRAFLSFQNRKNLSSHQWPITAMHKPPAHLSLETLTKNPPSCILTSAMLEIPRPRGTVRFQLILHLHQPLLQLEVLANVCKGYAKGILWAESMENPRGRHQPRTNRMAFPLCVFWPPDQLHFALKAQAPAAAKWKRHQITSLDPGPKLTQIPLNPIWLKPNPLIFQIP